MTEYQSAEIGKLAEALAKAQGEFDAIPREREVSVSLKGGSNYKFKYAEFATIIKHVKPVLAKHGLSVAQSTRLTESGNSVLVTTLLHSSGQWLRGEMAVRVQDQGAQAFGSALTYHKRYAYTSLLGLATDDDDDGNHADGNTAAPSVKAAEAPRAPAAVAGTEFHQLVEQARYLDGLSEFERKFVDDQVERIAKYGTDVRASDKQIAMLRRMVAEKGDNIRQQAEEIYNEAPRGHPALDDSIPF